MCVQTIAQKRNQAYFDKTSYYFIKIMTTYQNCHLQNLQIMKQHFSFPFIKTLSALLLLIISNSFAFAGQTTTTVRGMVQDDKGKPQVAATVTLQRAKDSALVKTDVTDANGKYEFSNLKAGEYFIRISSTGRASYNTTVFTLTTGESKELPAAVLTIAAAKDLGSVVVSGKKPMIEVKADKTIFNVEASINATGSNAMELLQKSPGVVVDKDDNISLKGKNGVQVFIDGRPSQMGSTDLAALLRSMNSADIEAIEMISNPSAKYEASGNAGIINIRLKKDKRYGTNGNISLGLAQGVTLKTNNSLSLNYRNKKTNWFGNYSNSFGQNQNIFSLYRKQADSLFDQKSVMTNDNNTHNFKGGVDLFLNKKSTLGFIVTGNLGNGTNSTGSSTLISPLSTGVVSRILNATNNTPGKRNRFNFNTNYRFADTSGHELNVDVDYSRFRKTGQSYQPNFYYYPNGTVQSFFIYKNNTPTDIDIVTAKVDYEENFKKGRLGIGGKFSYVKTANTFQFWDVINKQDILNMNRSNTFDYTENVNAAYVNYNRPLNAKWALQAGVRMEQTHSVGKLQSARQQTDANVKRDYVDLFPSAALTYTPAQKHQFTFTYSRRIDRPSYQDLNPFENKIDELTYQKGNAFLQPQYTNSFSVTHLYKYRLATTLGYSHITDLFAQITDTAEGNRTFLTTRNLATQNIINLNIGTPFTLAKIWSGYLNLSTNYSMYNADLGKGRTIDLNVLNYNLYVQNTFAINPKKGWTAELSGFYNGPTVWGGTFKSRPLGNIDIGVQKVIMHKNGTLKLTFTDVAHTLQFKGVSEFSGAYLRVSGRWEAQQVRLNFSYRFGNSNVKAARQRKSASEEESKRLNGGTGTPGGN